jgi:hypothetical protein
MEGSKAFAKDFMVRHSIPTAKFRVFSASKIDQAIEYVQTCGHRVVLKASGLAAGKGVLIPGTVEEALDGLRQIMIANVFGSAGLRPLPCIHQPINRFDLSQEARLSLRSCSSVQRYLFWLSQMAIL